MAKKQTRKEKDDAFAKSKGFKSYYYYRKDKALKEGYKGGYTEQRQARQSGEGLQGVDAKNVLPATPVSADPKTTEAKDLTKERESKVNRSYGTKPEPVTLGFQSAGELERPVTKAQDKFYKNVSRRSDASLRARPVQPPDLGAKFNTNEALNRNDANFRTGNSIVDRYYIAGRDSVNVGRTPTPKMLLKNEKATDQSWIDQTTKESKSQIADAIYKVSRDTQQWDARLAKAPDSPLQQRTMSRDRISAWDGRSGDRTYKLETYEKFIVKRISQDAFVKGQVAGLAAQGVQFMEVTDGVGCGWANHEDIEKADGRVVTLQEAVDTPLSHPNCVRRFYPRYDTDNARKERDGRLKKEREQKQKAAKESRSSASRRKTAAVSAASLASVAALIGLATTQINSSFYTGTLGDAALNSVGVAVRRTINKLISIQEKVLATLNKIKEAQGFKIRMEQEAQALVGNVFDITSARSYVDNTMQQAAIDFAENQVNFIRSKTMVSRILGVDELAPKKVVGDSFQGWHNWQAAQASIRANAWEEISSILGDESRIGNWIMDQANYRGRYARFSLPNQNTISGNAGKRVTNRYMRFSLNPNKIMSGHVSIMPNVDGAIRFVENIKLNPNGLIRLGFVRKDGLITPNLSLIPKGPIRVYSRFNRAAMEVTRIETIGYEVPMPWDATIYVPKPKPKTIFEKIEDFATLMGVDPKTANAFQEGQDLVKSGILTESEFWAKWKGATAYERAQIADIIDEIGTEPLNMIFGNQEARASFEGEVQTLTKKIKRTVENPVAGRVNSVTTEIRIITKWVPFNDSSWFKFRTNLRALEIYKAEDILDIDMDSWRRWAKGVDIEGEPTELFKFLSVGTNLRVKGVKMFDLSKTIRLDSKSFGKMHAGATNIDNNLRELIDYYQANVGDKPIGWEKFVESRDFYAHLLDLFLIADPSEAAEQSAKLMSIMEDLKATNSPYDKEQLATITEGLFKKTTIVDRASKPLLATLTNEESALYKELTEGRLSDWQGIQWYWHMVQQDLRDKSEILTDYMITMRRAGLRPDEGVFPRLEVIPAQAIKGVKELQVVEILNQQDEIEKLLWGRPTLLQSIIEADPVKLAEAAKIQLQDLEEIKGRIIRVIQDLHPKYLEALPERFRTALEERLAAGVLFDDVPQTGTHVKNVAGRLRWYGSTDEITAEGAGRLQKSTLIDEARPGAVIKAKTSEEPVLIFRSVNESGAKDQILGAIGGADASGELVEYSIAGSSVQRRAAAGGLQLDGQYSILGYRRIAADDPDFPKGLSKSVKVIHRVTLRQTRNVDGLVDDVDYSAVDKSVTGLPVDLSIPEHAARRQTIRRAFPEVVDAAETLIADTGKSGKVDTDAITTEIMQRVISDARPNPNRLYRTLNVSSIDRMKLALSMGEGETFEEELGLWTALPPIKRSKSKTPLATAKPTGRRKVVLVLEEARSVNLSPMITNGNEESIYASGGKYIIDRTMTLASDTGDGPLYVFMRQVRGPIIRKKS